jgi:hypothetical protein
MKENKLTFIHLYFDCMGTPWWKEEIPWNCGDKCGIKPGVWAKK